MTPAQVPLLLSDHTTTKAEGARRQAESQVKTATCAADAEAKALQTHLEQPEDLGGARVGLKLAASQGHGAEGVEGQGGDLHPAAQPLGTAEAAARIQP